jgi:hypothetical protein
MVKIRGLAFFVFDKRIGFNFLTDALPKTSSNGIGPMIAPDDCGSASGKIGFAPVGDDGVRKIHFAWP